MNHATRRAGGLRSKGLFKHTSDGTPLISIITVVFNGERFLEQTIQSVIGQNYQGIEYIIIDGGSTDRTLSIIERYDDAIDYWLSETDGGIADAMNKGAALASGDYLLFIHADDYLADTNRIKQAATLLNDQDIVLCDILFGTDLRRISSRGFNWWMNFKTGVLHQGTLCKREVFERLGGFDVDFKIAMDYDFFLRAYRAGLEATQVPLVLSVMRDTGISTRNDWPSMLGRFAEERRIHHKNSPNWPLSFLYGCYWHWYIPFKRFRNRTSI